MAKPKHKANTAVEEVAKDTGNATTPNLFINIHISINQTINHTSIKFKADKYLGLMFNFPVSIVIYLITESIVCPTLQAF